MSEALDLRMQKWLGKTSSFPLCSAHRAGPALPKLGKTSEEGPARQNLIALKFLPKIDLRRLGADGALRPDSLEASAGDECSGLVLD
jgi:hypothetical protein